MFWCDISNSKGFEDITNIWPMHLHHCVPPSYLHMYPWLSPIIPRHVSSSLLYPIPAWLDWTQALPLSGHLYVLPWYACLQSYSLEDWFHSFNNMKNYKLSAWVMCKLLISSTFVILGKCLLFWLVLEFFWDSTPFHHVAC